ncbi:insulin-induced protein [Coniochaeta sp. 2T2.1]|nr:insulin-induced protein [Coniochaeta sp. 2T2.1]
MDQDSPHILRPVPRRPFNLNGVRDPTPPPSDGGSDSPAPLQTTPSRRGTGNNGGLTPSSTFNSMTTDDSTETTLSRATSFLNLQKSTLFGIYQDSSQPASPMNDDLGGGVANGGTASPWGTGAETPLVKRPGVSDAMFEIMRSRRSGDASEKMKMESAEHDPGHYLAPRPPVWDAVNVLFRVAVLFGLGLGYGVLVGRFGISSSRSDGLKGSPSWDGDAFTGHASPKRESASDGWGHLLFWGFGGVAIGALLPWFDGVWEARFGQQTARGARLRRKSEDERRPPMDWSLVMRNIASFLGIVFAIRKLAWTSTMQVSLSLAVINPFLWYLIDRSKTGFLLSAAFSISSTAVLMGLDPDLMPVPTVARSPLRNATRLAHRAEQLAAAYPSSSHMPSEETVEKVAWMVSVLFCSCLVFGNIGRRMGLDRSAYTRGRWAGVR